VVCNRPPRATRIHLLFIPETLVTPSSRRTALPGPDRAPLPELAGCDRPDHSGHLPLFLEGQGIDLESTIAQLPLSQFAIDIDCLGRELAQVFEAHPRLQGAILISAGQFKGMLPRAVFLEYLLRPHGQDWFLKEPLRVLYSYLRGQPILMLPSTTPILQAAHQALRRSPDLANHPIVVAAPSADEGADLPYYLLNPSDLNLAQWQLRGIEAQVRYERSQLQLLQNEKMAQLGRLVDGVAHEILDPISFIWGNLAHVDTYSKTLITLLQAYEALLPEPPPALASMREALEIDYLTEDLPMIVTSLQTGAERLAKLASSLQNFCHLDEVHPKPVDIHALLDNTLLLLRSRVNNNIDIVKSYGQLPPIPCFPGQISQVLMNILSNAVKKLLHQAISQRISQDLQSPDLASPDLGVETREASRPRPTIWISTSLFSAPNRSGKISLWLRLCITNNGPAIPASHIQQIEACFAEPHRADKHSRLAMSHQLIAKNQGSLEVRSPCALPKLPGAAAPPSIPAVDPTAPRAVGPTAQTELERGRAHLGPPQPSEALGVEVEIHLPIT
jgi:signal transduction histidine kinase